MYYLCTRCSTLSWTEEASEEEAVIKFHSHHVYWTGTGALHLLQWHGCYMISILYITEALFQRSASVNQTSNDSGYNCSLEPRVVAVHLLCSSLLNMYASHMHIFTRSSGIGDESGLDGKHMHSPLTKVPLFTVVITCLSDQTGDEIDYFILSSYYIPNSDIYPPCRFSKFEMYILF